MDKTNQKPHVVGAKHIVVRLRAGTSYNLNIGQKWGHLHER